jgi:hypothetical protein
MRYNVWLVAAAAVAILGLGQAGAAPITSSLDCPIVNGSACAASPGSYGTITFTDAGANTVDIGIHVIGSQNPIPIQPALAVNYIALNYNESKFNSSSSFSAIISGSPVTVVNSKNGDSVNGSGNYAGQFDLLILRNRTITQAGSDFTIVLSAAGLTSADLVGFLDTAGHFDAAVHLENCGPNSGTCQPGQTGSNSLVVGDHVAVALPAPSIGLPGFLAVGGVLFAGAQLFRRYRKKTFCPPSSIS